MSLIVAPASLSAFSRPFLRDRPEADAAVGVAISVVIPPAPALPTRGGRIDITA